MEEEVPELVPELTEPQKRTPVTIITGLLGSGKTTLLNKILSADRHERKIAVILNEYDSKAADIERTMFIGTQGRKLCERWISLPNGCLCCSAKDAIAVVLERLLKDSPDVDHVVVETSGVANPARLIRSLWLDDGLESSFELTKVVTLVDASSSFARERFKKEWEAQVVFADVLILTKGDDDQTLRNQLAQMNPFARLVGNYLDLSEVSQLVLSNERMLSGKDFPNEVDEGHSKAKDGLVTVFVRSGAFTEHSLNQLMARLLWEPSDKMEIIRMKALVWLMKPTEQTHFCARVLQAVGDKYDD